MHSYYMRLVVLQLFLVLILVVMDDALVLSTEVAQEFQLDGLNPCCNG